MSVLSNFDRKMSGDRVGSSRRRGRGCSPRTRRGREVVRAHLQTRHCKSEIKFSVPVRLKIRAELAVSQSLFKLPPSHTPSLPARPIPQSPLPTVPSITRIHMMNEYCVMLK
eukprot:COSAG02_NODE_2211_length_9495_cov_3.415842_8_plen_112_part_00